MIIFCKYFTTFFVIIIVSIENIDGVYKIEYNSDKNIFFNSKFFVISVLVNKLLPLNLIAVITET